MSIKTYLVGKTYVLIKALMDTTVDTHIYFFRMKVGTGNSAFHLGLLSPDQLLKYPHDDKEKVRLEKDVSLAFQKNNANAELIFHLYTGYYTDKWIPVLGGSSEENVFDIYETPEAGERPATRSNIDPPILVKNPNDLFWMSCAMSPIYGSQSRILVYGMTHLFIFQPLNVWARQKNRFGSLEAPKNKQLYKDLAKIFPKTSKNDSDLWHSYLNSAAIQVKLVACKPRAELLPAIDSLAVFQWLSQGAFRPIFSCGSGRETEIAAATLDSPIPRTLPKLEIIHQSGKVILKLKENEHTYAVLVRKHLESLLSPKASKELTSTVDAYLLLSPSQLETAAGYLSMDLGYLPDFFAAGSRDYIDIRARKLSWHPPNQAFRDEIQKQLERSGRSWDWEQRSFIQFQCKNYENAKATPGDDIIAFAPLPSRESTRSNSFGLDLKTTYEIQNKSVEIFISVHG